MIIQQEMQGKCRIVKGNKFSLLKNINLKLVILNFFEGFYTKRGVGFEKHKKYGSH